MKFFDKYNLKDTRPEFITSEYDFFCQTANGVYGLYKFDNLEDSSSSLIVGKRGSFLVERFSQGTEKYMGSSTRISYRNEAGFYSVAENTFLKTQKESEGEEFAPIKSYEGFIFANGSVVDLTSINAEYIFDSCKTSIERTNAEQPVATSEQ